MKRLTGIYAEHRRNERIKQEKRKKDKNEKSIEFGCLTSC